MAQVELLGPIISKWEGKFVNDPLDNGGATNMGVTLSTWRAQGHDKDGDGDIDVADIKQLNQEDFNLVLKSYWDKWHADEIKNQSVANILVDWVWGSGKWGIIIPQRLLQVPQDGVVGKMTLGVLNATNQENFFITVKTERERFIRNIVFRNHSQNRFLLGWLNRLNDFKFKEATS